MNKTIVITGCSSGFGRDLAEKLARDGHRVAATMRAPDGKNAAVAAELKTFAESDGLDLRVLDLDVTSTDSVDAAAEDVLGEWGAPDAIVNNAGQMFVGITEAFSADELARQLDINVVGVHRVSRAFLPAMRERGEGLIVNISSVAGRAAIPFFGVYHASKWGLEGYTQALRVELASSGVDVVLVEPGPFTTNLFPRSPQPADAERAASYPPVVHETLEQMGEAFEGMFDDPEVPTDPSLVVEAMADLIAMAPGTRPFRTVVGVDLGVRDRNAAIEPHDVGVLEALGMTDFATLATHAGNGSVGDLVTFEFEQAATGPGTFAGTFTLSGAASDSGITEDALAVSSAEGANPMVATFRRTVTGEKGTLVLTGAVTVDLADPAEADVDGSWRVELATGNYTGHTGEGAVSGTADFTLPQPHGSIRYDGTLRADG